LQTSIVLFTRDLRLHDQSALSAAALADRVVPLFVIDDRLTCGERASPSRTAFLRECLVDLDKSLRGRGGRLVLRRGDPVAEVMRLAGQTGAATIHLSEDYSAYARRREERLEAACAREGIRLHLHAGITAVPPGELTPAGGDHYRVFTPYWRAWRGAASASPLVAPRHIRLPSGLRLGRLPALGRMASAAPARGLPPGGERVGRARLKSWLRTGLRDYEVRGDLLSADATSGLGPYLHFGCLSPGEVIARADGREGAEAFVRQLCWRDFHHQVLAARPDLPYADYRPRGRRWRRDQRALDAWREGRTGFPIVDAGMRQLAAGGVLPNRARLIAASFLTKTLGIDWREGARHFDRLLVDGDLANNAGNWQWVAGTGNDTRPNRVLNPIRQARRFDPDGAYVRRHVAELSAIQGGDVHEPWKLSGDLRERLDYPDPIIDP
jgi:deoxyribodipyrimidine photo-lyase